MLPTAVRAVVVTHFYSVPAEITPSVLTDSGDWSRHKMRVLMLGWEYPPHITGGLGTACEGLTTSLARKGIGIDFIVPHLFGGEEAPHMSLMDSHLSLASASNGEATPLSLSESIPGIRTHKIPSMLSPYLTAQGFKDIIEYLNALAGGAYDPASLPENIRDMLTHFQSSSDHFERYGFNIFDEVSRYTGRLLPLAMSNEFDVIHAHDWMTFPAGVAAAKISGKPLVVHVHSLEYDRSGACVNQQIYDIERMGLEAATAVITVSHYSQKVIQQQHGISADKIAVVHNGVYPKEAVTQYRKNFKWPRHVVLFLGRVTFQKGPDYFVEAARKVIPHVPDVLFVLAGSGDMLDPMKARVHEAGISEHFLFPGFLRGEEVDEIFSIADLYVMPSVSEPFGISALEAIAFDTPAIISKQSGVAEVVRHSLKTDFWDTDRIADLIINALSYPELREDMISMAREELKRVQWDAAAVKTVEVYERVTGARG